MMKKITVLFLLLITVILGCEKKENLGLQPEIKIESYYPNSGKSGTLVTIAGSGLSASISDYQVSVGDKSAEIISATDKAVVFRVPQGESTANIILKFGDKTWEVGSYSFQELTVSRIFPTNGSAGTQVRIEGEGFGSTDNPAEVFMNGKKALVVSASDKVIVAEVPEEAGYGPVEVKVDGKRSKGQNFKYQSVSNIKPLTGGKGTKVTITGTGFEENLTDNVVDFNGKKAIVLEASATQLLVIAPDEVSTGPLSVNINTQKITGPAFTVVGKPIIGAVSPLSGPKGAEMTINGELFSTVLDENKVFINNVLVPLKSATANQIKLMLPGGTGSGTIRVVVNDQTGNGPEFKDQNLGILKMTPDNGLAGTTVTITGTGFSTQASDNKVYFNGVLSAVKSATETQLVLDAPQGFTTGEVRIAVNGQEALAPTKFRRAGVVTLAGGPGTSLFADYMTGIAVDQQGNVYVTDTNNKQVKKISPSGAVSVLQVNGSDAKFNRPFGIVIDKNNTIYIGDSGTNEVIKITASGQRSVYVSGFSPAHMDLDNQGNLYVSINAFSQGVNKVIPSGSFTKMTGPSWVNTRPAVDDVGNFYYGDQNTNSNNGVGRIASNGTRTDPWVGNSDGGYQDAVGGEARFNGISAVAYNAGKLFVAEGSTVNIRQVDIGTRMVTTLYKSNGRGFVDGSLIDAKFNSMTDIATDKEGNVYVLDASNRAIRKIFFQ
ncbi:IPT/TIG domain-containing protein [Sphingobacterium tabacisoli]|uniref:IPT/TIG domain-containing protein n=1 Tax=Sphingobacterium tabacisoli TaxID=2044855 RepID=A0ABW5L3Y3_9SPHI|nr:IPT/TIG domain-containing protein [Sphingobacterium tabacisoli]